ncbi:MAG: hypothetical protein AB7F50_07425 [Fimbriimonadaceae bacterium]
MVAKYFQEAPTNGLFCVSRSLVAVLELVFAKAMPPSWFELPAFALAIPAVPWIMPCLIGLIVLRRAGSTA